LRVRTPIGNPVDLELQRQWDYARTHGIPVSERIVEVSGLEDAFPPSVRRPSRVRRIK
jgi:hypothetical protein